jgi:hypothetical protein
VKRLPFPFLTVLIAGHSANGATPDTQGEFWLQVEARVGLNSTTRLFLLSSFRNNQPGDRRHGYFGAHLNFALKPVLRRELRGKGRHFQPVFRSRPSPEPERSKPAHVNVFVPAVALLF